MRVESREEMVLRVLYHLARSPLEQFPMGPGAAMARVKESSEAPLYTPLTGRHCVAHSLIAHYFDGTAWAKAIDEEACADFVLHDEEAEARVDGAGAKLALVHQVIFDTRVSRLDLRPILESRGLVQTPALWWYLRETVLLPGDRVVVAGQGEREPDPDKSGQPGYRGQAQTRPLIRARDGFPLAISNNSIVFEHSHENIVIPG